jgi:hypothetical protein
MWHAWERGRKIYRVLVGKPEGKRPLERPRRRWEDGIRMDLSEIGCGGVEWIYLAQDRDRWRAVVNAVMNPSATELVSWLVSWLVSEVGIGIAFRSLSDCVQ